MFLKALAICNLDFFNYQLQHKIKIFITEPNQVRLVSTPDRHFAVFANEYIPAFTKFGPFEGEITENIKQSSDSYWIVSVLFNQLYKFSEFNRLSKDRKLEL